MRKQILFVLFSLATLSIHADEGMWMLTDLKTQNAVSMRELGLEIPIEAGPFIMGCLQLGK